MIEERGGAKGYNENVMTGCRPDCRQKAYVNGYWEEVPQEKIRKYGFAFEGKEVLIG